MLLQDDRGGFGIDPILLGFAVLVDDGRGSGVPVTLGGKVVAAWNQILLGGIGEVGWRVAIDARLRVRLLHPLHVWRLIVRGE